MLSFLYNELLYRPLLNALVFLTGFIPGGDVGAAIILLTLLVRLLLFPLTHRSLLTQRKLKELEPEISKIRAQTKDKTEEQGRRLLELYKQHGVNPLSGVASLFIQLPILIALYQVFWRGITFNENLLYPFVAYPETLHLNFLGLFNLAGRSWILAALATLSQFFQMKLAMPTLPPGGKSMKEEFSRAFAIQSRYVFPVIIFYISLRFPAALALYWTVTNLFAIVHEWLVRRRGSKL